MRKAASVICDNIVKTLSVHLIDEKLLADRRKYKSMQADIEVSKFTLDLNLKTSKDILASLSKIQSGLSSSGQDNVTLQFDVGDNIQYLPLKYQIRAAEMEIFKLENQIKANAIKYKYYAGLLALNQQLHTELKAGLSSDYTIDDFYFFLTELYAKYDVDEVKDYLGAYTKRVENRISVSVPVSENPTISIISKGTVKKSGLVFAVAFMMSVFASFIHEGIKKN